MSNEDSDQKIKLIADFEGDAKTLFNIEIGDTLPILPLRNMVLFPGIVIPITVGRESSLKLVKLAQKKNSYIGVVCQKDAEVEKPELTDLYAYGTVARVVRVLELPDHSFTVLLQGFCRFKVVAGVRSQYYIKARVEKLNEIIPNKNDKEFSALADACRDVTIRFFKLNEAQEDQTFAIRNITEPIFLVNFLCTELPFPIGEKEELLQKEDISQRAYSLLNILNRETQFASLKANIQERTREDIDKQQREYFLQQQLKNIQNELGDDSDNDDIKELKAQMAKKKLPQEISKIFEKELAKLSRINPQNPDYNVQLNYLQTIMQLPWGVFTTDNLNVKNAARVLNRDHYGLEKVKERILEHLAVLKLRGDLKSPILCLYGPPGVGKTSLGKSIADSLKRKYVRISLGGVHDEAEIRGHRRTYIGAMPGRIVKSLIRAGSSNPVFILDEIDKVSSDNYNGDPASALLEVLDPEQNNAFHDNFLDLDYDLSKVLFIATANNLNTVPQPLLDRMELIEMSGYLTEEKIEIAKRHLIPKEMSNAGLDQKLPLHLTKPSLEKIIEQYTRESGVRGLEKQLNKLFRKIAFEYVKEDKLPYADAPIGSKEIEDLLGKPPYSRDKYQGNKYAGVVTGLAWTSVGGEILFIETSLSRGKGAKLTLTGNLGDVMKESAVLALEYIKAHSDMLQLDYRIFEHWNIHIHVPEGAVPKDGPSAGITIATSLASALTQRKVRPNLAMTGEITLRGKVLPVGGIKEKILAAKRAGITDIMMSEENEKNVQEIPELYVKGLTFHYVENVKEVFDFALLDEKVDNAITLSIEDDGDKKDKESENE